MSFISILLPTRERTQLVEKSIKSLLDLATDPSDIEILIAYDEDDQLSQEYFNSSNWASFIDSYKSQSKCFSTPKWGYGHLEKYYNFLGENATGKWLMLWNDDALMSSEGWDTRIQEVKDFVGLLHMTTDNFKKSLTLFPLVPDTWLDLFGSFGHTPTDSWIQDVCTQASAVHNIDVHVLHDRYDVTGNNKDLTYLNRRPKESQRIYKSNEMQQLRHKWACRLKEYKTQL